MAYRRSARAGDSDPYRAIYLPPGVIDLVVEDVLLARGTVIVRAVSEANSIPGVPVRVYLENYMDQMVFSKGTVLASSTWDPKGGVEIDLVILQILNQAHNAALNAGVALSPERRGAVLLPGGYFFDAIEASGRSNGREIRLVVAEDSWRSTSPVLLNRDGLLTGRNCQPSLGEFSSLYGNLHIEKVLGLCYNGTERLNSSRNVELKRSTPRRIWENSGEITTITNVQFQYLTS